MEVNWKKYILFCLYQICIYKLTSKATLTQNNKQHVYSTVAVAAYSLVQIVPQ